MKLQDMIYKTVKKILKEEYPALQSIYYPVYAKVTKVHGEGEYVDIRVLDKGGNVDEDYPEIPKVKTLNRFKLDEVDIKLIDTSEAVNYTQEIYAKIKYEVGDIVRIGFYYNDLSRPFVERKVD